MNKEIETLISNFKYSYEMEINNFNITKDFNKLLEKQKYYQKELLNAKQLNRKDILHVKEKELEKIEKDIIQHPSYADYCDMVEYKMLIKKAILLEIEELWKG